MVARTSAGTGIVVSLVVFVLTTVFLLILSIVFYSARSNAQQDAEAAEERLSRYVSRAQRNDEKIKSLESSANPSRNESVVKYLIDDNADLMAYLSGDGGAAAQTVKDDLKRRFGVPDDGSESVSGVLGRMATDLRQRQTELDGLNAKVTDRDQEIDQLEARIKSLGEAHAQEIARLKQDFEAYATAVEDYRTRQQQVAGEYDGAKDRLRDEYEERITSAVNRADTLDQERVTLQERVNMLQEELAKNRIKPDDPAKLVDGRIIEAAGAAGQVFIDRGSKNRIARGMTFEVYDDESALLQSDPNTGEQPRGKASLQVIKVGETTSTCKITRSVPGRPVIRNDVVANAVYDPTYQFKFLVFGKFDVDNDGRPSDDEAEYLRNRIVDWGGVVVTGDELPGDLDFLVLGIEPTQPMPLGDTSQVQVDLYVQKKQAYQKYQDLFRQAREAQIPVLNANRFFVLIGDVGR